MKTVYDLMLAAAKHLTGKDIVLRFQEPVYKEFIACTMTNPKGRTVIDLSPALFGRGETELKVFLHELAHARLHEIAPSSYTGRQPQSMSAGSPQDRTATYTKREREAEALAGRWLAYGKRHHQDPALDDFEGVLLALLGWEETIPSMPSLAVLGKHFAIKKNEVRK